MPPKKKPAKKAVKKKAAKKKSVKKKAAVKGLSIAPCICIENERGWFCMKRKPNGELVKCSGPFASEEICNNHVCRS